MLQGRSRAIIRRYASLCHPPRKINLSDTVSPPSFAPSLVPLCLPSHEVKRALKKRLPLRLPGEHGLTYFVLCRTVLFFLSYESTR
jgi:hypothetical protein